MEECGRAGSRARAPAAAATPALNQAPVIVRAVSLDHASGKNEVPEMSRTGGWLLVVRGLLLSLPDPQPDGARGGVRVSGEPCVHWRTMGRGRWRAEARRTAPAERRWAVTRRYRGLRDVPAVAVRQYRRAGRHLRPGDGRLGHQADVPVSQQGSHLEHRARPVRHDAAERRPATARCRWARSMTRRRPQRTAGGGAGLRRGRQ